MTQPTAHTNQPTVQRTTLASDNYSGVHPHIMQALCHANVGHDRAYGYDGYSQQLDELIATLFGQHASAYLVFNGTGANVLGLSAMLPRFGAVICAQNAHIHNDESIAPEYVAGIKILATPSSDGKLNPDAICTMTNNSEHRPQARAVYISQVTELGTCYSLQEIKAIKQVCEQHGLYLYIDGARLCNAVAHLGCSLADIAATGVDMLSLGGTKNGLMMGECLVVLNPTLNAQMKYLRKSSMQLASKMRFIACQFVAWLQSGLYLELAAHSNQMAQRLYHGIKDIQGVRTTQLVQSNVVFAILPPQARQALQADYQFYTWNETTGEVRLMTSFDTTPEQIDLFIEALHSLC